MKSLDPNEYGFSAPKQKEGNIGIFDKNDKFFFKDEEDQNNAYKVFRYILKLLII